MSQLLTIDFYCDIIDPRNMSSSIFIRREHQKRFHVLGWTIVHTVLPGLFYLFLYLTMSCEGMFIVWKF